VKSKTASPGALLLLAAASVGWWGCTKAGSPYPDVASFCAAKAKAECQVSLVCASDASACASYRAGLCVQDAASATASGTRTYDPGNVQPCLDALNAAYGNTNTKILFAALVGPGSITDKCERVFAGIAVQDKPCVSDYDCTGELICSPATFGATEKVCAPAVSKNLGDFCSDPGSMCPVDAYCANTGAAPECQPSAAAGMACSMAPPCISTERCIGGFCADRATAGQACTTNDDCAPDSPYCDPNGSSVCTIGLTFARGALDCQPYMGSVVPVPTSDSGVADSGGGDSAPDGPVGDSE
jgi:hypothetical protein